MKTTFFRSLVELTARAKIRFAWLFAPLLCALLLYQTAQWIFPQSPAAAAWLYLSTLPLLVIALPQLIVATWRCKPLRDKALAAGIEKEFVENGLKPARILVWQTQKKIVNAFVVGMVPWKRSIVLTDVLLESFSPEEIVSICRHEIGHIKRWHLQKRLLYLALPLLILTGLMTLRPDWTAEIGELMFSPQGYASVLAWLCAATTAVFYYVVVVGEVFRQGELEADYFACWNESAARIDPHYCVAYSNALTKLALHVPQQFERPGWVHPSIQQRLLHVKSFLARNGNTHAISRIRERSLLGLAATFAWGVMTVWFLTTIQAVFA